MVASVIALIALAALTTAYSATASHSSQYLMKAHLHQQLHSLMHTLVRDIRRTGFWSFDPGLRSAAENPFEHSHNRLRTGAHRDEPAHSCILFAYDLDQDGLVGVGRCRGNACGGETDRDNVEQFGFRLRDGRAQMRYGGNSLSCNSGHWQALTDPGIEIHAMTFTTHSTCLNLEPGGTDCQPPAARLVRRLVEIRLSGRQRRRPDTALTLSAWVRVRNDQLMTGAH
jgi:type II secretory pathway component PulJ